MNNKLIMIDEISLALGFDWKITAVELLRDGMSQVGIAKMLGKNERTIRRMVRTLKDSNIPLSLVVTN